MNTIETLDPSPFKHLIMTIGELPSSFVESMSYYEMVAWLVDYIQKNVVTAVNNNALAIQEIQEWISTLDIQSAVDTKLDEMAESGELADIIADYLQSNVTWTFDTVSDLKAATNLSNGDYVRTLGFHSVNDGGGATYIVSNSGTANEMDIIALSNSLFANLIEPTVLNPEIFGAYGDNQHNDSDALQAMFDKHKKSVLTKHYVITHTIEIGGYENLDIDATSSIIEYSGDAYAFLLSDIVRGDFRIGQIRANNGTCMKLRSELGADDSILYLNIWFGAMRALDKCIEVDISEVGYINELRIHGGLMARGNYGVYVNSDTDHNFEGTNGIYCYNICFEGTTHNYYFRSPYHQMRGIVLRDDRNVENPTSIHLTLDGKFTGLDMTTWGRLKESRFDFSNATTLHNINLDCPILTSDGSATFAQGLYYDINGRKSYVFKKRLSPSITKSDAVTAGNVYANKDGNVCYITISNITSDSHSYDIVEAGNLPADFIPTDLNKIGSCVTLDGETARFYVTTSGKITFEGNAAGHGKGFYGEVVYDPHLENS